MQSQASRRRGACRSKSEGLAYPLASPSTRPLLRGNVFRARFVTHDEGRDILKRRTAGASRRSAWMSNGRTDDGAQFPQKRGRPGVPNGTKEKLTCSFVPKERAVGYAGNARRRAEAGRATPPHLVPLLSAGVPPTTRKGAHVPFLDARFMAQASPTECGGVTLLRVKLSPVVELAQLAGSP